MIIIILIIAIAVGVILLILLTLNYYPPLGKKASKEQRHTYSQSRNFAEGKFINQIPTSEMENGFKNTVSLLRDFTKGNPNRKPATSLPVQSLRPLSIQGNPQAKVTWFGHSTLLLELDGKTLLLDPMFGKAASPFPRLGAKRYSDTLPIEIDELPMIDAVLLSHDHYDHLDYDSIKKLQGKVRQFFVPLGVASHLESWGVDREKIKEHDWWDESEFEGLTLACTPSRHFSGRSLTDRNTTLWCSWVLIGQETKIYFSGDSGYGPHFAKIGETYGPFDMTFMECGQYDERWGAIHMMPEETVQAHLDVKGDIMIPIHWAAFSLAFHDWTEPIERVTKAAQQRGVVISTPKIGEPVIIGSAEYPASAWWR
jgi:L-ascorbate metabolism protein UlaG (beta-lactamase superfamily)